MREENKKILSLLLSFLIVGYFQANVIWGTELPNVIKTCLTIIL